MDAYKYISPSIKNRSLSSVTTGGYNFRLERAKQQSNIKAVDREVIIKYVNEFLDEMGMKKAINPHVRPKPGRIRRFEYSIINPESKEDIVWIKFTKDNYISVVGTSCDISFSEYAKKNTSAGIINQVLGKEWDESDVLIFPLIDIPDGLYRSDIESGIGNYLISKGVPILDYYSHNF